MALKRRPRSACNRRPRSLKYAAAFSGSTMPSSDSSPRMRLRVAVRCATKPWRARCTISSPCCCTLLTGTKRMFGRVTASQIAAASAASFLPRLPDRRYGATNFGAIRRTVWPCLANSRAQWCAPEHASMPIRQGGSDATSGSSLPRVTAGRCSATLPVASTPCRANTFFARSMPSVTIAMDFPSHRWLMRLRQSHRGTLMPYSATAGTRDGEVPFIR